MKPGRTEREVVRRWRTPTCASITAQLADGEWISLGGLLITRPARIAADLLTDREDPEAVAQVVADAIRGAHDHPGTFADSLAPHAAKFGLRRQDGISLLRWLLDLVGDAQTSEWMGEARAHRGPRQRGER